MPNRFKLVILANASNLSDAQCALLRDYAARGWTVIATCRNPTSATRLTAYAAAGLAGTKPIETGFTAWAFAKGLYVIPLVMAVSPLIGGSGLDLIRITVFTAAALYAFAGALQGYFEGPINPGFRLGAMALAAVLIWPHGSWSIGGLACAGLVALVWISKRPMQS